MYKLAPIFAAVLALAACSKTDTFPGQMHKVTHENMVLVTRIDGATSEGDPVRLKHKDYGDCQVLGKLTKDFSIDATMVECGDKVTISRRTQGRIKLDRTHTFVDADGKPQSGYAGGESLSVPNAGIDIEMVRGALEKGTLKP